MWQRFTEGARRVVLLGQEEAGKMSSGHVGTEHLLLGLLREYEGVAAQVLQKMGITERKVRAYIDSQTQPGHDSGGGEPKLTPKAKRVLELAADEARRMLHTYIGTEHLLLALLREKDGLAAQTLRSLGLNLEQARAQVMEYLGHAESESDIEEKGATDSAPASAPSALSPPSEYAFRDIHDVMVEAMRTARESRLTIQAEHLLLALLATRTELLVELFGNDWNKDELHQRLLKRLEERKEDGGS